MGIDAQMLLVSKKIRTEAEVLEMAYNLAATIGYNKFFIQRDGYCKHHCLEIVDEFTQDGESIFPENNEQLIEVNLMGRYYGVGYERGALVDYIAIAEYLEFVAPDVRIYYGGDSGGICAELFNKDYRQQLWEHFCINNHMPYVNFFGQCDNKPICTLCTKPYVQSGWGAKYAAFYCPGCGHRVEKRDMLLVDSETGITISTYTFK